MRSGDFAGFFLYRLRITVFLEGDRCFCRVRLNELANEFCESTLTNPRSLKVRKGAMPNRVHGLGVRMAIRISHPT